MVTSPKNYDRLFSPLVYVDSDKTRVTKTLRAILLTVMAASFGVMLIGMHFHSMRVIGLGAVSLAVFFGLYLFHRKGFVRAPAFVACIHLLALASYGIYTGKGIHDVAIMLFPAVLLISSLLLQRTMFYLIGLLALGAVAITGVGEMTGFVKSEISSQTTAIQVILAIILIAGTVALIRILTSGLSSAIVEMQKSEESYRAIFNAPSEAIFIHDATSGAVLDVNETMLVMYRYRGNEVPQLTVGQLSEGVPPYTEAEAIERIRMAREQGPQLFAWRSRRKDGTLFWTEVALRLTTIGGAERVLAVVRDVDDKMRMEEELRQSEKMQVIGQLAGGIAHDFNNQLGGIIGFAELLAAGIADEKYRRFCNLIISSAESAAKLNKKLLRFARKGKSESQHVDINDVVTESIAVLTHSVDKRVEILYRPYKGLLIVSADPAQLQNALLNLGINARDAMPDGGTIEIETERTYLGEEFCAQHLMKVQPGDYATISVTDSGQGIPEAVQNRMYEPFFTTKEVGKGTGMGLSAVYATVTEHKGLITCYSELNVGTVFKLYLPLADAEEENTEEGEEDLSKYRGTETILLVDDEPTLLDLGEKILSDLGYTIRSFNSPLAAMVYYKTHVSEIDLVVLDMVMPRSDGFQTFKELQNVNPKVKAVVCSGYSKQESIDGIMALGALEFVSKPFRRRELVRAIHRAIHREM